jgi:hypothetical protein
VGEKHIGGQTIPLIRLHVIVEGQTEEGFVNQLLAPELGAHGVFVDAHCITTGRHHGRVFRGGLVRYEHLANDLSLWMRQDQHEESWFTTMFDLYGLPADFPGRATVPQHLSTLARVSYLETALFEDIAQRLKNLPVSRRFIPYIQTHEFETLLFSEPAHFLEAFPDRPTLAEGLTMIRRLFNSPEEINDGPDTAPSKRILQIAPEYEKPVAGLLVAQRIGLPTMRRECAHFDQWVARLLALAAS